MRDPIRLITDEKSPNSTRTWYVDLSTDRHGGGPYALIIGRVDGYFAVETRFYKTVGSAIRGASFGRDYTSFNRDYPSHKDYAPQLRPLFDLHLSWFTGRPLHSLANGMYWLAGMVGGLHERYHGGDGDHKKNPTECADIFAKHCRINTTTAWDFAGAVLATKDADYHKTWKRCHDSLLPQWRAEADYVLKHFFSEDEDRDPQVRALEW